VLWKGVVAAILRGLPDKAEEVERIEADSASQHKTLPLETTILKSTFITIRNNETAEHEKEIYCRSSSCKVADAEVV